MPTLYSMRIQSVFEYVLRVLLSLVCIYIFEYRPTVCILILDLLSSTSRRLDSKFSVKTDDNKLGI